MGISGIVKFRSGKAVGRVIFSLGCFVGGVHTGLGNLVDMLGDGRVQLGPGLENTVGRVNVCLGNMVGGVQLGLGLFVQFGFGKRVG